MPTRKRFELLDCPKFAYPSLTNLDVALTAANITERLEGKGFLNYGQVWPLLPNIIAGKFNEDGIKALLSSYKTAWKNENLREVAILLLKEFGTKGRWFKEGITPFEILPGAFFKPSIRGTWYFEKQTYAVCINARKHQRLFTDHARFLARGVYELHSINDPTDPRPLIIDVSAGETGKRELRKFLLSAAEMMHLEEFEAILRKFFEALSLAGVTTVPERGASIADLFRRRRFG